MCDLFFCIVDDGISNTVDIKKITLGSSEMVDMAQSLFSKRALHLELLLHSCNLLAPGIPVGLVR